MPKPTHVLPPHTVYLTSTTTYPEVGHKNSIKAKVFGEMVKLAYKNMQSYQSDLFHDANFMRELRITGDEETTFWWAVWSTGTYIAYDHANLITSYYEGTKLYKVTIYREDNGNWYVRFEGYLKG
jgi:hypothetical protein